MSIEVLQSEMEDTSMVTTTLHQKKSKVIHVNSSKYPSGIDRVNAKRYRRAYWKQRAADFTGNDS